MKLPKREVIMAELKGTDRFDPEVLKLLKLTNVDDLMLQMIDIIFKAQIPHMEEELSNSGESDFPLQEYMERVQQRVDIDSLLYQMVPMYSRYYSREDIAGLIAFYETPLGSKLCNTLPQIMQETIAVFQEIGQDAIEKAFNELG